MSSYNGPQQYNAGPEPGPYGPQQPRPYVEQQPPPPNAGGQPPYPPPGAYTPMPPPPPRPRRRGTVVLASVLSIALLAGIGAFVFFNHVWTSGPDPAERFPSSAAMYVEVNFDPSFDQTPKLLEHLNKFEGLDYDDTDDMLADLLEEAGLDDVDAEEDLASWLGRRHGFAVWEYDGKPYGVVNLASTDAEAAESGLEKIRTAAGVATEEWAFSVGDDSVLMVLGDGGAREALAAAESEAGASPLSESDGYEQARSWLDGDQLLVYWIDTEGVADIAAAMGEEEEFAAFETMYSGDLIAGLSAFDDGFELSYRLFGDQDDPWTGSEDLLDDMAALPAGDIAAVADLPDELAELSEEWMSELEGDGAAETGEAHPEGEGPLTDQEYAEYQELDDQWWNDTLAAEDQARYEELENRYWQYGTEDEPNSYEDYSTGPDFEEAFGSVKEFTDLLSGARLSFSASFPAEGEDFDPETVFASVVLAGDQAEALEALISEHAGEEELPEGIEVDGSTLSFEGADVEEGRLGDDDRFADFAAGAPDSAALAVWVDMSDVVEYEDLEGAEPLSAFAWAHGTVDGDGTGLARLYLE
ncbi:hypothetical protein L0U85_14410 [Glycomyces sp. L485]|uniref:hypothetical protein n=1 Tax=Glycomyces sp. L485 TaxID=2909235 RepID=UPI001F4AA8BF|nr:hypothetical protein [Glycomyces sp. L485]MCH7232039.1 hypothetical protein [Glycomyces sp. L485]